MNHRLVAPVERVAAAPGTAWAVPAVIVDAGGAPVGFARPGDRDCGTFGRDALDDVISIRQLRTSAVTAVCGFQRVVVGGGGAGLDRLELEADVAVDGRDDWRALERRLLLIAATMTEERPASAGDGDGDGDAAGDGPGGDGGGAGDGEGGGGEGVAAPDAIADGDVASPTDALDDGLQRALADALESFVRGALRGADAGGARDGSLVTAIAPHAPSAEAPVSIGGGFALHALRVTRAAWAERAMDEDAPVASLLPAAEPDATPATGFSATGTATGDATSGAAGSAGDSATDDAATAPSPPSDVADAPLAEYLGSNAALADVWSRETKGDRIAAIGGVVHGGSATVMVLHPDPTRAALAYSSALVNALAAELRAHAPRIIVLPAAETLRELLTEWLAEQAPPPGVGTTIVVDGRQSRVVLELTGAGAAEFVQRVADEGQTDLAALGSVLPWRVVLRATGGDGLVEADSAGSALRRDTGDALEAGGAS